MSGQHNTSINAKCTSVAAVFGNPIAQSKSPIIQQHFAKQFGIQLKYTKQLGSLDSFEDQLSVFLAQDNAVGVNITMPFKERAFEWVDDYTDQALRAGAVNTLIRKPNSTRFIGANTDGDGLVADLLFHSVALINKSVLLIGAGGAAKGALPAIVNAGVSAVSIFNRTTVRAEELAEQTNSYSSCPISVFVDNSAEFDIIINATSLSLQNELPSVPTSIFKKTSIAYDMVYLDHQTSFLKFAEQAGASVTIDGLGMLVEQAAVSFRYWFNKRPDTAFIRKMLRSN